MLSVQGLALLYCQIRLRMLLHVFVIFDEPEYAHTEHWVPLADVPVQVLLQSVAKLAIELQSGFHSTRSRSILGSFSGS